ncbi:hypothetical protein P4216_21770, partial [Bacillus thuringiensis]|nr:hypothetical protein [Bacillus thuringiensis]
TLWRDISNGKPGILKIWTGTAWESVVPDVESVKKETLEQVTKEINASAEKLDARVKEAETKADNLQKDFNAVKGEQERVSQVTKALEESDEATKETITRIQGTQEDMNKTIVETTKGVEGLQSTVSDIKKDQNGITDRVVKTEQNINGISSSIEQINKTSSQTIQKLNKVEEDANGTKQTIERIEKNVNNLDGDVINLVRGTKTLTVNEELSLKGARLAVIKDTYNGNAIAQTDTEWQGVAVKPSELIKRGKIKIGDTVTFSVIARMIGGESTQVFFPNSAGKTTVNGEWKRVSVTIPVGSDATDPNVVYRFEAESMPKGALYQQTSPMLSLTKKVYPWRPAPEDQADGNEFIKVTTEIKQEAGRISEKLTSVETKVNSDKSGGRNLLLDSNTKYEKTDYLINPYSLTENFVTGEEYTFVIKGSVPQGQQFGIWQNGGSNNVGYATSIYANGITYVTFKAVATTSGNERRLNLYNYPNNATKATVEWVALYKGNKPQDWTPAPEEQVTTNEFTKKTTEITKSVDGIKETITKVENNQSGFDKRVATVEKDATAIKQNVSFIQNTQTEQGRQLQEAKAGWENTAKALEGKVELKQVEDYVAGFKIPELKQTVNQNKQDLLDELANKLATEQFNQKMTLIDNRFTINEQGINAAAKKTEVYTIEQANGQFAKDSYVRDMETRLQLTEKG